MKILKVFSSTFWCALICCVSAHEQPCGGILEGDNGNFQYSPPRAAEGTEARNCIWLVQAAGASKLLLTFTELLTSGRNFLILYPERSPGETHNPIRIPSTAVGSTFDLPGSTVIIILPQANSTVSFTWDSEPAKCSAPIDQTRQIFRRDCPGQTSTSGSFAIDSNKIIADYIETPVGKLTWSPRSREESLRWIIHSGQSPDDVVEWMTTADLSDCDKNHPCSCLSFEAYGIDHEGYLVQMEKACGASSSGSFHIQSYPLVIAASANTSRHGASGLELRWVKGDEPSVTSSTTATTTTYPSAEATSDIYFATEGGGIKAYSLVTSTVSTVLFGNRGFEDIAYDPISRKIYYGNFQGQISRSNTDGSGNEALQSNVNFNALAGLHLDWSTGNLYVVRYSYIPNDNLFVCNTTSGNLICASLPSIPMVLYSITLDPLQGEMFITGEGGVYRAGMDGSNFIPIDRGYTVAGIALDPASDRLYWAGFGIDRIFSSFRNGSDIQSIVQLDGSTRPFGLVVLGGSVYWGNYGSGTMQRSSTSGEDLVTIYAGKHPIQHLAMVPWPERNEFGHEGGRSACEIQGCSHICVLTGSKSFRCLCPEGLRLAKDQINCIDD